MCQRNGSPRILIDLNLLIYSLCKTESFLRNVFKYISHSNIFVSILLLKAQDNCFSLIALGPMLVNFPLAELALPSVYIQFLTYANNIVAPYYVIYNKHLDILHVVYLHAHNAIIILILFKARRFICE